MTANEDKWRRSLTFEARRSKVKEHWASLSREQRQLEFDALREKVRLQGLDANSVMSTTDSPSDAPETPLARARRTVNKLLQPARKIILLTYHVPKNLISPEARRLIGLLWETHGTPAEAKALLACQEDGCVKSLWRDTVAHLRPLLFAAGGERVTLATH